MSVLSVTAQPESTQPPPIPIQSDEDSAWPEVCCVALGTVQSPVIELNNLPFCSSVPWLYPNQLVLVFACSEPSFSSWPWCGSLGAWAIEFADAPAGVAANATCVTSNDATTR